MPNDSAPPQGALPTRALGKTGMDITRVGFGAWAAGGTEWGSVDDADSVRAIRHALACGINWIDTAPIYGFGHSEEIVRRALQGMAAADRPYVFTKCGLVWDEQRLTAAPQRVGTAESLRRELDASLRRLGVERIDLYQVHRPADDTALEVYWETLLAFQRAGKIRAAALSNHSVAQLERAERLGHVASLQPPFSAIRREEAAEIEWCRAHGTGVIVYSPMQAGLLTGAFTAERARTLPATDWRSRDPYLAGEALQRNLAFVEALKPIAARRGVSLGALAVAWVLAWPGVTGASVGARTAQQVDGWIGGATVTLSGEELEQIAAALERTGAGSGPVRPPR
jgi:aryl-alcohol dehydrogenase-like predicted oxidoreductase